MFVPLLPPETPAAATAGDPGTKAVTDWHASMRNALRSTYDLLRFVGLEHDIAQEVDHGFPVFVPLEYARRMRRGDADDPLLRQVLPVAAEGETVPGFISDPVGDHDAMVTSGLIQKYDGRALMITTGACGVHCRYCFRRSFPYSESAGLSDQFDHALEAIEQNKGLDEVLLSGGDPLTLNDVILDRLLDRLESVPHLRRVRFHTRMPIVIPSRVSAGLVERLRSSRLTCWFVVHCNHANELDEETAAGLAKLIDAGVPVLNQAVLLRGVNDQEEALVALMRRLVDLRVQPYYLHQLDRVSGAAHFEVSPARGSQLMQTLHSRLPGYAVPRYVREIAGCESKTPITDSNSL
ncbi:MAG: EF-P beta-lysylation protein EpmB [Planctomycetota bacterium]